MNVILPFCRPAHQLIQRVQLLKEVIFLRSREHDSRGRGSLRLQQKRPACEASRNKDRLRPVDEMIVKMRRQAVEEEPYRFAQEQRAEESDRDVRILPEMQRIFRKSKK